MPWKGFRDIRVTIEIDLSLPLEELWKNLDKDARWGVKKAQKEGLVFKEADENEERAYYKIYKKMCERQKIKSFSIEELKKVQLKDNSYEGKIFVCKKNDIVIAGASVTLDRINNILGLFTNASLPEFLKYQPNNLIYWSLIKWGKENGFSIFDLGGYQPNVKKGDKLYYVNKFKERWGGRIVEHPIYSKNFFYILGRKLIRRFSFLRKMKNEIFNFYFKKIIKKS